MSKAREEHNYIKTLSKKGARVTKYQIISSQFNYDEHMSQIQQSLDSFKAYYASLGFDYHAEIQIQDENLWKILITSTLKLDPSYTTLAQLQDPGQKVESFLQLAKYLQRQNELELEWINLNPMNILISKKTTILSNFYLPVNQISKDDNLRLQYLAMQPPEYFSSQQCQPTHIVWQLGCLLYFILQGRFPFLPNDYQQFPLAQIRRNIITYKYQRIEDSTIQEGIFDRFFVPQNKRLTLERIYEVVQVVLASKMETSINPTPREARASNLQQQEFPSNFKSNEQNVQFYHLDESGNSEINLLQGSSVHKNDFKVEYNFDNQLDSSAKEVKVKGKKRKVAKKEEEKAKKSLELDADFDIQDDQHNMSLPSFDHLPSVRSSVMASEHHTHSEQKSAFSLEQSQISQHKDFDMIPSSRSQISNTQFNANSLQKSKNQEEEKSSIKYDSFVQSARPSEMSASHRSNFEIEEQSSMHQSLANYDLGDSIAFIVVLNENQCIGITVEAKQFLLVDFSHPKKKQTQIQVENLPEEVPQIQQVVYMPQGNNFFVVASTSVNILIFELTPSNQSWRASLIKTMKVAVDCICLSLNEPCFYYSKGNKILKTHIDKQKPAIALVFKRKLIFEKDEQVKAVNMVYTVMRAEEEQEVDGFFGISTSDFSLVILRIQRGNQDIMACVKLAHQMDITQVLPLTDYENFLSFVTMSLDCQIKGYSYDGELEFEAAAEGQVLTGINLPSKKDYYLASMCNEETEKNSLGIFRKHKLQLSLGPYDSTVLDLKLFGSNKLFFSKDGASIDRIELKGF